MSKVHVLLVEDNEGDILLTKEALEEEKIFNSISVVKDGEEAIRFLTKQQEFKNVAQPDLILLDINLPKKNGHEVLKFIKNNETLKKIPVIMLTTSSAKSDINLSYGNHANCFITKPLEVPDFFEAVKKIESFWTKIVSLPKN